MTKAMTLAAAAALLVLSSGCAVTTTLYADEHVEPYLRSLANRPAYPLARSLTWKYHYTVGAKNQMSWVVVDGELIEDPKALAGVQMYASMPTSSGVRMSDVYDARASQATNSVQASMYKGLSSASLQAEMGSAYAQVGANLGAAIANAGAKLLDAIAIQSSTGVANYVKQASPAVIGEAAAEGSVLELFFRVHKADGEQAAPADAAMRWETVATLKDGDGRIWRSSAAYTTYVLYSSEAEPAPAKFSKPPYVLMDIGTFLPAKVRRADYEAEVVEVGKIALQRGYVELGVSAMHAVRGLYEQIEFSGKR